MFKFNAPKNKTWFLSLILIISGISLRYFNIEIIPGTDFYLVLAGGILLLLGTLFKYL